MAPIGGGKDELYQWLKQFHCESAYDLLVKAGFDSLNFIARMDDEEIQVLENTLKAIPPLKQRRILKRVKELVASEFEDTLKNLELPQELDNTSSKDDTESTVTGTSSTTNTPRFPDSTSKQLPKTLTTPVSLATFVGHQKEEAPPRWYSFLFGGHCCQASFSDVGEDQSVARSSPSGSQRVPVALTAQAA